jgi:hypothetical protein
MWQDGSPSREPFCFFSTNHRNHRIFASSNPLRPAHPLH